MPSERREFLLFGSECLGEGNSCRWKKKVSRSPCSHVNARRGDAKKTGESSDKRSNAKQNSDETQKKRNWIDRQNFRYQFFSFTPARPEMNLWFNLPSLFCLHSCLICIRCSPSKFRPTARTRPSETRHNARTRWCCTASWSWAAWKNHTSTRWTRIREMPITYVSVDRTTLILVNWRLRTAEAALNGFRSIRCRFVYNQFVDEL